MAKPALAHRSHDNPKIELSGSAPKIIKKLARKVHDIFMIMWDESDIIAGDCDTAMNLAANATFKNMKLTVGDVHEHFFKPVPSWIDPFVAFAKGE